MSQENTHSISFTKYQPKGKLEGKGLKALGIPWREAKNKTSKEQQ